MTFPIQTIDLSESIFRAVEGTFRLIPDVEISTGQWDATPRASGPRHMRWSFDLTMAPLYDDGDEDRRMTWDITVARMQGGAIALRAYHPARLAPRGFGAGIHRVGTQIIGGDLYNIDDIYLVDGHHIDGSGSGYAYVAAEAPRYAEAIQMTGLVPSALVFRQGDHFSTGGNLYMVSDDCRSDADGRSTVPFLWKLWKPALIGDRIDLIRPTGRFVIASKDGGEQRYTTLFGDASLQAIEVPHIYD